MFQCMSKPEAPSDAKRSDPSGRKGAGMIELLRALALDAEWPGLETIVLQARAADMSLSDVHDLVRAMGGTIASLSAPEREAMAPQIRAAKYQAALLLLDRAPASPLFALEREALLSAAELLLEVDSPVEAAPVFERAGEDGRAAQAWGAAGDIARMEACLKREQEQREALRDARELAARFEDLMLAGQRLAAIDLVVGSAMADAPALQRLAREAEARLCSGRSLALRTCDGTVLRFAGLPAVLGRDGRCQVVVRDPGVSRRHARIWLEDSRLLLEDVGSRTGTCLCGARLAGRVPLPHAGDLSLGEHCRLTLQIHGPDLLELACHDGLDRGLRVWLAPGPLPLSVALPGGEALRIVPAERTARIDLGAPVRLNGKLVGKGFDVLRGDIIQSGKLRLEVL